jgi:CRISPR-associated protein Cas2
MLYTISYDIPDDGRRLKVAKVLKDFGERVHFSVFEARLRDDQLERLKKRITKILEPEEDSVRIYTLCAACAERVEILGQGMLTQDPDIIVI